jgi:hypothetical protein
MKERWIPRRAHKRRLKTGLSVAVRETWELRAELGERRSRAYRHACPQCGAGVISVHMNGGGWVHFESAIGLGRVKHACFHRGEGLSRRRDNDTLDLFEELVPPSDEKH